MIHPIEFAPDQRPRLVVLIDIEEEFDWRKAFDRNSTAVTHIEEMVDGLSVFDPFGIVPTGVVSYPVAASPTASSALKRAVDAGRLRLGAHLHPWVNPPHDEEINLRNSFPGNLPAELEAAKLHELTAALEQAFGERPRVYQAGRYGLGPNSAGILLDQGYRVSMTVNPPFDHRREGGPNFSASSTDPYWFGEGGKLLEIPVTGAFLGIAGRAAPALYRFATAGLPSLVHMPGILARLGLAERIRLSPEGQSANDMIRLTRFLFDRGSRMFVLSFHSPTLKPGCTSYVRTTEQRAQFLKTCRRYFEFFFEELNGRPEDPLALHAELDSTPRTRTPDSQLAR